MGDGSKVSVLSVHFKCIHSTLSLILLECNVWKLEKQVYLVKVNIKLILDEEDYFDCSDDVVTRFLCNYRPSG